MRKTIKNRLQLAFTIALKDVKIRYKNSILGYFWSLLTPLIYLVIFIVIFSSRFQIERYPLYALSGLIFWNFFNTTVNMVLNSIVASSSILKAMRIPPLIFPFSSSLSSLINLSLSLIPFFILVFFSDLNRLYSLFNSYMCLAHL